MVDKVDAKGTRKVAEAYLIFSTARAQEIIAQELLPAADPEVAAQGRCRAVSEVDLFTVDETSAAGRRRRPRISPTAACSTRFIRRTEWPSRPRHGDSSGARRRSALPGFGLTLGVTLLWLSLIVADPARRPCCSSASSLGLTRFVACATQPRVLARSGLVRLSLAAAAIDPRLRPARRLGSGALSLSRPQRLLDAIVDLPFALPTAVAGIALTDALRAERLARRAARARSASRSPIRRSASSSRWSSSACPSSCARCSR